MARPRSPDITPHSGVDFGGGVGAPILAAADGEVYETTASYGMCGARVVIFHREFRRYTVYCHLQEASVEQGQRVKRGEVIGLMGMTGFTGGVPHLHFELNTSGMSHPRALPGTSFDPLALIVGCFDPGKTYPTEKLVLTYPVKCKR